MAEQQWGFSWLAPRNKRGSEPWPVRRLTPAWLGGWALVVASILVVPPRVAHADAGGAAALRCLLQVAGESACAELLAGHASPEVAAMSCSAAIQQLEAGSVRGLDVAAAGIAARLSRSGSEGHLALGTALELFLFWRCLGEAGRSDAGSRPPVPELVRRPPLPGWPEFLALGQEAEQVRRQLAGSGFTPWVPVPDEVMAGLGYGSHTFRDPTGMTIEVGYRTVGPNCGRIVALSALLEAGTGWTAPRLRALRTELEQRYQAALGADRNQHHFANGFWSFCHAKTDSLGLGCALKVGQRDLVSQMSIRGGATWLKVELYYDHRSEPAGSAPRSCRLPGSGAVPAARTRADSPARPLSPPRPCVPSCKDRDCGDDGCGGDCGLCNYWETCRRGRCEGEPPPQGWQVPDLDRADSIFGEAWGSRPRVGMQLVERADGLETYVKPQRGLTLDSVPFAEVRYSYVPARGLVRVVLRAAPGWGNLGKILRENVRQQGTCPHPQAEDCSVGRALRAYVMEPGTGTPQLVLERR